MLRINSSEYNIDRDLFEETIGADGFDMYIDTVRYNLLLSELSARLYTAECLLCDKIRLITYNTLNYVDRNVIVKILSEYFNIESLGFKAKTQSGKMSTDITKVFIPLRDYARKYINVRPEFYSLIIEFCDLYIDYSKLKTFKESMAKKKSILQPTDIVDNDGRKLSKISSLYIRQSTGRYYTSDDNLQGWNLGAVDTFTAPKDYFFVWADFDQIDLRVAANMVLFQGHPEMVKQFDSTSDKYEAIARIISDKMNKPFDIDRFKANRKAYKQTVLARLYGASKRTMMSSGFTDVMEINMLDEYYNTHEYYQHYVEEFKQAIGFDTAVFIEDYFGYRREIPIPANKSGNKDVSVRVLEQCLNTPIQSTSNDIVMIWVNEITKKFREYGFGLDKLRIALLRHDEGIFLVHRDCIPYLWIFKKYSSIFIDSWSELTINPKFGFNYKIIDEHLEKKYNMCVEKNTHNIISDKDTQISIPNRNWIPCKKTAYAYHFAPLKVSDFAYILLSRDDNWLQETETLRDMINSRDPKATEYARTIVREYKESPDAKSYILEYIENFNKYFRYFIVFLPDGTEKKVLTTEFIPYLVNNGIGYVYVYNTLTVNYSIVDSLQIKYTTDISYESLTRKLEAYV